MNKKYLIATIVIVVILALGVWLWMASTPAMAPATENQVQVPVLGGAGVSDPVSAELDALDLGNIDQDFQDIDSDLKTL